MEKIYLFIEKISVKFVLTFCFLTGALFAFWAGTTSNVFPADYVQEIAIETPDSILVNILAWMGGMAAIWAAWKIISLGTRDNEEKLQKRLHIMMISLCVLLGIALSVWINLAHYTPIADQYSVYTDTLKLSGGDYSTFEVGGYAYHYPYQLNMTFVFQILFSVFHTQNYKVIQYLNIVSILLTIYFGYRILKEVTKKPEAQVCYMMFGFTFIPLFLYSQFVYGDVISVAMASIAIWSLMRWCDTKKVRYGVIAVLALVLGIWMRINVYVVVVAICIGLLYHAVKKKCWRTLLLMVLCVAIPWGSTQLIKVYYESKSGMEVSRGLPMSYLLHNAMQEAPNGPGSFNLQLFLDYGTIAGYDYDYYDLINRAAMKRRLQDFMATPSAIPKFYRSKILLQWNDYTFSSADATHTVYDQMSDVEWSVYYGSIKRRCDWYMDRYLFIIYLSFAVGALVLWRKKRELYHYIPLITVIGGVLYSILIESKGRYVMPYVILMQPFAAIGLGKMICWLEEKRIQVSRKFFLK